MANVSVFDMQGKEVGKMDLNDAVFGVEINEHLLHLAVVAQLANKRQGTQKALTSAEVSGGGRKPWRQKGTGHARQGSIRAPQWKGGGVVFAPVPRDYTTTMNKKEKRAALKSALTNAVQENKLIVVDEIKFDEIKTPPPCKSRPAWARLCWMHSRLRRHSFFLIRTIRTPFFLLETSLTSRQPV